MYTCCYALNLVDVVCILNDADTASSTVQTGKCFRSNNIYILHLSIYIFISKNLPVQLKSIETTVFKPRKNPVYVIKNYY